MFGIKQYEEKWRINICEEEWEFNSKEEMKATLEMLINAKENYGKIKGRKANY